MPRKSKTKDSRLADRDFVLLVAVILVLIAIVLVCCKQSVPAALLVLFVMALLALSIDKPKRWVEVEESTTTTTAPTAPTPLKARPATTIAQGCPPHILPVPNAVNHVPLEGQGIPPALYLQSPSGYPPENLESTVPVQSVTVTNVPVKQSDPPMPPKVCSVNSKYNEYNPPEMISPESNTYQDLYVLPTEVSRPPDQSIAQVQAKTMTKCIKKEIGAFPAPDRMKGSDVFLGEDPVVAIELERLKGQASTNSLVIPPQGSSLLNAALEVSPPALTEYYYVKPLPDHNKEMKQKIRNEGLYGIHGDLNCMKMRRSTVADTGFVQPINARQEFLKYLAYDMPNYKNQWQTARANTVNADTRYFK